MFNNFIPYSGESENGSIFRKLNLDSHFMFSNERPLKMMKKAFYFILKAPFFLKIFKFLS